MCIDYRRVNQMTRLMIYSMPMISDLLQDMDKAMWYCSLDMASGFWVVEMTERARVFSGLITIIRPVWMAEDAVWIEERAADLATPDRQCVKWVFEDWYTSNYYRLGIIRSYFCVYRRWTGFWHEGVGLWMKVIHRRYTDTGQVVGISLSQSGTIAGRM